MLLTLLEMKFKAFVLMTISFACLMAVVNIKVKICKRIAKIFIFVQTLQTVVCGLDARLESG